ncbi:MAG: PilZ domain-containing protein [Terriglobales bacterium]
MLRNTAPSRAEIAIQIRTLEQAAQFFGDLATTLPEHADWLWDLGEKVERAAAELAATLRTTTGEVAVEPQTAPAQPDPARPYPSLRRFPRWIVAVEARVNGSRGGAKGFISELSEGGLKAATGLACQVGEILIISWQFPGDEAPLQLNGSVRYRVPDGSGIQFLDITPADRVRIQHYCKSHSRKARAATATAGNH